MGGSSGGSSSGTTSSKPWKEQQPYLKDIFKQAQTLTSTPLSYYPGQTVAGFDPYQVQAQDVVAQRALGGSDLERMAQAQTLATARGDYLDPNSNPWLQATYNQAWNQARPNLNANAVNSGRYGSAGYYNALGNQANNLATSIYGGNYQQERDRQMNAVYASPGMAQIDYQNAGNLAAVGQEKQAMQQALIDAARQKFEWQQSEPYNRLGAYQQYVGGNYGGTTSSSTQSGGGK